MKKKIQFGESIISTLERKADKIDLSTDFVEKVRHSIKEDNRSNKFSGYFKNHYCPIWINGKRIAAAAICSLLFLSVVSYFLIPSVKVWANDVVINFIVGKYKAVRNENDYSLMEVSQEEIEEYNDNKEKQRQKSYIVRIPTCGKFAVLTVL
jgi:hypothetical protein